MINNKKEFKMIQKLKHLKYFSNYIAEQEMPGEMPMDGSAPNPQAAPTDPVFKFLFLNKNEEEGDYKYPDGSSSKRYNTYQITKTQLIAWLDKNITGGSAETKRKSILEYISGDKSSITPNDKKYIESFKNAVTSEMEGKQTQDTEVIFSPSDRKPTTDVIDVTFIITPDK
jgi:hypothetical protein